MFLDLLVFVMTTNLISILNHEDKKGKGRITKLKNEKGNDLY